MVQTVQVRRADIGEWPAVRLTRLAALADSPSAFGSTPEREAAFDDQEWQRRVGSGTWFLAWLGERPVGIIAGGQRTDRIDERHLGAMWVTADHRGTAAATQLVEAVCAWARAQGAGLVTLWVADGNSRARRFYERLEFRPTGERQALPSAPEVGEELMQRLVARRR